MDASEQPKKSEEVSSGFFKNPKFSIIKDIFAVLSIPLAIYSIYLTISTQQYRQLNFTINPSKAIIVKSGESSKLSVTYNGKEINTDLTAVQIAFWNSGSQSIRKENILKPLVFRTSPDHPIIETQIRKVSRDVTGIKVDQIKINNGEVTINWDILEKNDGGIIQLIIAGNTQDSIKMNAVIEGQKNNYMLENKRSNIVIQAIVGASIIILIIALSISSKLFENPNWFLKWFNKYGDLITFLGVFVIYGYLIIRTFSGNIYIPPFGW